jgi:hypothetical protein
MTGKLLAVLCTLFLVPAVVAAQEKPGAERTEITAALFGGGVLLVPSSVPGHDTFHSYVLSGAYARNLNRYAGAEFDMGFAFGRHETYESYGVTPTYPTTPNMLFYGINLVYNPVASDHPFVPYFTAGVGGLNVFGDSDSAPDFALATNSFHLTGSIGVGARWYPIRHWGLRGDYRYMGIANDALPTNGDGAVRSGHRIYMALMMTF